MRNNMSKLADCYHSAQRKDCKNKRKKLAQEQKELEVRMEVCDKSLDEIKDFKEKTSMSETVLRALWRGEDELIEERYMISSDLFDLTQQIAENLMETMKIDNEASICSNHPCSKQPTKAK